MIHVFDGVPFAVTPYRAEPIIRNDVFWRQFTLTGQGNIEHPETDRVYETW